MKQSTYLRKAILALKNAGWILTCVDTGDDERLKVKNTSEAIEAIRSVDMPDVFFEKNGKESYFRVCFQGPDETYEPGEEVIYDYGMSLDPVLSTLSEDN